MCVVNQQLVVNLSTSSDESAWCWVQMYYLRIVANIIERTGDERGIVGSSCWFCYHGFSWKSLSSFFPDINWLFPLSEELRNLLLLRLSADHFEELWSLLWAPFLISGGQDVAHFSLLKKLIVLISWYTLGCFDYQKSLGLPVAKADCNTF